MRTTNANGVASPGRARRTALRAIAVVGVAAMAVIAIPGIAGAASPSDDRATFVGGNVTTCSGAGFASDVQMGSGNNSSNSDANVTGTVKTNAGTTKPGQGQEVNVAITAAGVTAGVVIDGVIVKGGPAWNKYVSPAVLPPTLGPDQHYISPLNGGGNVPTISHWFVCYHFGTPPPVGSISVTKAIVAPDGIPVTPLPDSYSAIVNCNDGTHTNIAVSFGAAGGAGTPSSITGIAVGTVCTVVEQNTGSLPDGTVVSYTPSGVNTTGVTIGNSVGVLVTITNDYSDIDVQRADLIVAKVVTLPNGTPINPIPTSFSATVSCDDGSGGVVTLPGGAGGTGTPTITGIKVGSNCTVVETTVIDSLATKSYSPVGVNTVGIDITSTATVTVTITNNYSGVQVSPADVVVTPAVVIQPSFAG